MALQTSTLATTKIPVVPPVYGDSSDKVHQQQATSNHELAFKLMALAVSICLFRFLLGLVRYVLDFVLCVLVLGGAVAVFRPGPKDGMVSVVLAQLGAIVDPFDAIAERHESNYTGSGDSWSYYHGQCYIGTRVEFVLLPSILGLVILGLAMVALWRRWPARWCRADDGDYSSCASSVAGPAVEGQRRHPHHHGDEHMPLLIDNDPCSLPAASHRRRASLASGGMSIEARRHHADHSWGGNVAPASSSLEEHYGSWCQRNGNMVQNVAPDAK
ncbi:hypothetical protein H4R27_002220 [Coemansia aciculifera]|nr:hypothetical protein H4R27_002220 [Coemansia aciculifera]